MFDITPRLDRAPRTTREIVAGYTELFDDPGINMAHLVIADAYHDYEWRELTLTPEMTTREIVVNLDYVMRETLTTQATASVCGCGPVNDFTMVIGALNPVTSCLYYFPKIVSYRHHTTCKVFGTPLRVTCDDILSVLKGDRYLMQNVKYSASFCGIEWHTMTIALTETAEDVAKRLRDAHALELFDNRGAHLCDCPALHVSLFLGAIKKTTLYYRTVVREYIHRPQCASYLHATGQGRAKNPVTRPETPC